MAVRRTPLRRTEREEVVAYLHGIDQKGEIVHILVHKRGSKVRFSGGGGPHQVADANTGDLENWVREAETALGLEDVIGISKSWMNIPESLKKMEILYTKSEEKKKRLETSNLP